ncbi:MAG: hypothetical protein KAH17_03125 [Bacteroidales bacterium]|nr:hypothetical protein [Bacteroidales bacterium]
MLTLFKICKYLFVLIFLITTSCQDKFDEEIISNWPNGEVQKVYFYTQKGDVREKVQEERFYENGTKEMHGEFYNGNRHGMWTYWFQDGRKWSESEYENDLRIGPTVIWRESGLKNYEGSYSKGKPHGTWTFYDLDGSRLKDVLFEHGEKIKEIDYKEGVPFNPKIIDSLQFRVN